MNVCVICQADGVLEALGTWYCKDHLDDGLWDVAEYVDRVGGTNYIGLLEAAVEADKLDVPEPEPAARPFWNPPAT